MMKQKKSAVHIWKSPADSSWASLRHQTKVILRTTVKSMKLHHPKLGEAASDEMPEMNRTLYGQESGNIIHLTM